jgi:hypothetical protein
VTVYIKTTSLSTDNVARTALLTTSPSIIPRLTIASCAPRTYIPAHPQTWQMRPVPLSPPPPLVPVLLSRQYLCQFWARVCGETIFLPPGFTYDPKRHPSCCFPIQCDLCRTTHNYFINFHYSCCLSEFINTTFNDSYNLCMYLRQAQSSHVSHSPQIFERGNYNITYFSATSQ